MAEWFDIDRLALPPGSEIAALLQAHPDILAERFADEEMLIRGRADDDDVFLLLSGSCLVEQPDAPAQRRSGDAMAVLDAEPDAPVFVGEMAYLGDYPRSAGVRSVMATVALRMRPIHLDAIISGYPGLTRILCRQFAERLRESNEQLRALRGNMALHPEQVLLEPHEVIFSAGAAAQRLFQLVDGVVVLESADGVREVKPSPGTPCFLEARAFFSQSPWPSTARTRGKALLLAHGEATRAALVRCFPEIVLGLLR